MPKKPGTRRHRRIVGSHSRLPIARSSAPLPLGSLLPVWCSPPQLRRGADKVGAARLAETQLGVSTVVVKRTIQPRESNRSNADGIITRGPGDADGPTDSFGGSSPFVAGEAKVGPGAQKVDHHGNQIPRHHRSRRDRVHRGHYPSRPTLAASGLLHFSRVSSPPTCSLMTLAITRPCSVSSMILASTRPNRSRRGATRPVQPVWWLAPSPAPLSPWKYS